VLHCRRCSFCRFQEAVTDPFSSWTSLFYDFAMVIHRAKKKYFPLIDLTPHSHMTGGALKITLSFFFFFSFSLVALAIDS